MNRTRSVLMSVLLAAAVPAQAGTATTARAERDTIAAEWTAATKAYSEAMKVAQATEEWKAAAKAKDRKKMNELTADVKRPDSAPLVARALEAAGKFTGDDRLLLLSWAALNSSDAETVKTVVGAVRKDHIKSPALAELLEVAPSLSRMLGADESQAFLASVVEDSPNALPRAWAKYWQATNLQRGKNVTDEQKRAADELLADAEKLAAGTALAERIAAPRFEAEHLQIGMVAPDIEGEDLDGVTFKLSDYRGKVVVLDFWGFW